MRLFGVEDAQESPLLDLDDVDAAVRNAAAIADDVDEALERVQAAEQIVVLPVPARQECAKTPERAPLQAGQIGEILEHYDVLRTDAVDQDLVELAALAPCHHRERQDVPE